MEVLETPLRLGEKQTRVSDSKRRVPVVDAVGRLVVVLRDPSEIARHLSAPNAEGVRDHRGQLRAIRLMHFGDDRGHSGELHGSSLATTERCRNDYGEYIGALIKHKLDRSDR